MRRHWLLFVGLAGCRACQPSPEQPADAGVADAAIADAAPDAAPAPTLAVDRIHEIYFSPHGQLAFLVHDRSQASAFRVVDVRSGREQTYASSPPIQSELGFDNRCDVSSRGYMPNIDVWYVETDPTDTFFVRQEDGKSYREDAVHGTTEPAPPPPPENPGVTVLDDKIIAFNVTVPFSGGANTKINHVDRESGLLVVERPSETNDLLTHHLTRCAFDLHAPTKPPICVEYQPADTFERELASPDGQVFVWNSVVWGSTQNKTDDYWERDDSKDTCFLRIINLKVGKSFKVQSPCALTGERPLRFEDNILVTDDSNIYHCSKTIERRYDVTTGAFRGQKTSPPFPEDVAPELLADIKRANDPTMALIAKPAAFARLYHVDAVVAWSEGKTTLARKDGKLVLCTKLTGECGAPLMPFGERDIAGVSKDGSVFGVVTNGHFIALDGTTGQPKTDIVLSVDR